LFLQLWNTASQVTIFYVDVSLWQLILCFILLELSAVTLLRCSTIFHTGDLSA